MQDKQVKMIHWHKLAIIKEIGNPFALKASKMYERQKAKSRKTETGKKDLHIPEKIARCT